MRKIFHGFMVLKEFLDREKDVRRLRAALDRPDPQFIVVYGRRRIGKSSLIKHVIAQIKDIYFLSDQTSEQNQRMLFSRSVAELIEGFDKVVYPDWETVFRALNNQLPCRITICLDEFPYLVKSCPSLPSVIQKLLNFKIFKFDLVLCGSSQQLMYSCVMDKKSPLYGLADEIIKLSPIPAGYISKALDCSASQAVEEYSIWGGVPRYWELRNDYPDMESAIRNLLLDTQGILSDEPQRLLRDDMRETIQSATLLSVIGEGSSKISEIASRAGKPASEITETLKKLRDLGFVAREVPFGEDEKNSKKGLYHISDSLFRFYYKFVSPYISLLELGDSDAVMALFRNQQASYTGVCWEHLCRRFVSGRSIDGVLYNRASRWWGKAFPEGEREGRMMEFDVVAESFDKKHILIGECKWTRSENAEAIVKEISSAVPYLPFIKKGQSVQVVLFMKNEPLNRSSAKVFLPEDVLAV